MAEERKRSARKGDEGKAKSLRVQVPAEGMPAHVVWGVVSAVVLALCAMGLAVTAIVSHFGEEEGGAPVVAQPTPTVQPTSTPPATVSADDDPSIGPDDALVTIIEFNDFQ
jgi:hypothetical protein